MRLLDLFCGAGGAATGYVRAGFEVVGIDIKPQPSYPFEFHEFDAITFLGDLVLDGGRDYDAIHASPPCQDHSPMAAMAGTHGTGWMLNRTMDLLTELRLPWVVENVEGAAMLTQAGLFGRHGITLCGSMFGLTADINGITYGLRRHRRFESNVMLAQPPCRHGDLPTVGIYGHGETSSVRNKRGFQVSTASVRREIMDMPWANRDEIAQAIPPAYTEWIGTQLLAHLSEATRLDTAATEAERS